MIIAIPVPKDYLVAKSDFQYKNSIPFDPKPANVTSGIRLGTPAVSSRGFGPDEMRKTAQLIARVLGNIGDETVYQKVRDEVAEMNNRFSTPGITT